MFRKEFADVISKTGMVPLKDLRPLLLDKSQNKITEAELLKFDFFDDLRFAKQVADNFSLTFIDLSKAKVSDASLSMMKRHAVIKYRCVPIQKTGAAVSVAIFDPSIVSLKSEIQTLLQRPVEFILTNISSWMKLFNRLTVTVDEVLDTIRQVTPDKDNADGKDLKEEDIGEDIIRYVNYVLADSFLKKASDIHIEPYEKVFRIRYRIDGTLVEIPRPSKNLMLPMISRMKIMAQMDISEKRKPQDGRIKLMIAGMPVDFRVSSLPTLFGEKIVMRLLDSSNLELDMTKLGFEQKQLNSFKEGIYRPFGMCLVTGPTGSGKTTTLYSALADINKIGSNISTAEDPVEFNLEGINQVNVRKEIGLTFASALKAFLRQDPDIIMVGEIRDYETGEIAVEAALTGHLVLSTLHTNDAPSTVTRLLNMGIEPFLVVGALNVIVAQRLCRKLCPECKERANVPINEVVACGVSENSAKKMKLYKAVGCSTCNGAGYKGRIAIYEVMTISQGIRELILENKSSDEIKKQAIKEGMKTLRMSALTKVAQGLTTLDEAVSNSGSDKF